MLVTKFGLLLLTHIFVLCVYLLVIANLISLLFMYLLLILYGAGRNYFDADNIEYEGHWNGWALKWQ
jgi:hypothetical protein